MAHFRVLARFEEGRDANQAVLVVPHDGMNLDVSFAGDLEGIVEDCLRQYGPFIDKAQHILLTIEAISSSLAKEALLVAGVRDISCAVTNKSRSVGSG